MAQRKLKPKVKVPNNGKAKAKPKGVAVTKSKNCPIQPKKKGSEEARKLRQVVTKTVNKTVEADIRSRASHETTKTLSKAQQAVADHHKKNNMNLMDF